MKLIVTGGTGFIGSHVLKQALTQGHEVLAWRRPESRTRLALSREPDWQDWGSPLSSAGDPVLLHLAAHGVSPQPCSWPEALHFNVTQSVELFLQAIQAGIRRIVVCGSCVEYGASAIRYEAIPADAPLEPIGPYATSKASQSLAAAALCREHHLELAILRPFTVFGEGQHEANFWPSLRKAAETGADFPMTPGEQVRDFISVDKVAERFLHAATRKDLTPGKPRLENVGSGHSQTLRAFAEYWWESWSATGRLQMGALPYRANEVMRYVPLIES